MASEEKLVLVAIDKITAIDTLIHQKTEGSALELARKVGISRSTFFRLIKYMRTDLRAPIQFNTATNRYVYEPRGRLFFGFIPGEDSFPLPQNQVSSLADELVHVTQK